MKRDELKPYFDLLESFQGGGISAETFETEYLALFKADKRMFSQDIFDVLNRLFSDVDAFVLDSKIRNGEDLDENQLLECSRKAYLALGNLCVI